MNATVLSQLPDTDRGNDPRRKPMVVPGPPRKRGDAALRRILAMVADVLLSSGAAVLAYELRFSLAPWSVSVFLQQASQRMQNLASIHVGVLLLYVTLLFLAAHSQNLYLYGLYNE